MDLLPEIRSSSEIYGTIADGTLQGIPISGVSDILYVAILSLSKFNLPLIGTLRDPRRPGLTEPRPVGGGN